MISPMTSSMIAFYLSSVDARYGVSVSESHISIRMGIFVLMAKLTL